MTLHDITWITCHYMQNKMLMPLHLDNDISPTPGQLEQQTSSYILVCTSMYWYVGVQHFTLWYVPVYTGMYQTAILRTWYILVPIYTVSKSRWFFTLGASILGRYMEVPRTEQHILVLQVQNNPFSSKLCTSISLYTDAPSISVYDIEAFVLWYRISCSSISVVFCRIQPGLPTRYWTQIAVCTFHC